MSNRDSYKYKQTKLICLAILIFFILLTQKNLAKAAIEVVFNEIAWMGTKANSSDEWLELYNTTEQDINLAGWKIYEQNQQTVIVNLNGTIKAKSYYLIERTDDKAINDIPASQKPTSWGGNGLNNKGENLQLVDNNSQIIDNLDCTNKWFAGKASPDYKTMERKDPFVLTSDPTNWDTNDGIIINGHDIQNNPIYGTPNGPNSVLVIKNQEKTILEEPAIVSDQTPPPTIVTTLPLPSNDLSTNQSDIITINQTNNPSPITNDIISSNNQMSPSDGISNQINIIPISQAQPIASLINNLTNEANLKNNNLSNKIIDIRPIAEIATAFPKTNVSTTIYSTNQSENIKNKSKNSLNMGLLTNLIAVAIIAFFSALGLLFYNKKL